MHCCGVWLVVFLAWQVQAIVDLRTEFHASDNKRRLQASGDVPERTRFEAEVNGHAFGYEYAARDALARVVHLDDFPGALSVSCFADRRDGSEALSHAGDAILEVEWSFEAAVSELALEVGDFILVNSTPSCEFNEDGLLLFRVSEMLPPGFIGEAKIARTRLAISRASPFEVVHDVYMKFDWMAPKSRQLQDGASEPAWEFDTPLPRFEFNAVNGTVVQDEIELGPLVCEGCFASIEPHLAFELRTNGATPELIRLRLSGAVNVTTSWGLSEAIQKVVSEGDWRTVAEEMGPELISQALSAAAAAGGAAVTGGAGSTFYPVLLPLFSQLTESLDIALIPYLRLESLLDTASNITMDGRINIDVKTEPETTFMEVTWTAAGGLVANANLAKDVDVSFTGVSSSERITAGVRACSGLELNALGSTTPFTAIEVCPEQVSEIEFHESLEIPAFSSRVLTSPTVHDTNICFNFMYMETDGDLDLLQDEPFLKGCLAGRCVSTSNSKRFEGSRVTWTEQKCMTANMETIQRSGLYVEAHEQDTLYAELYAEPYRIMLSSPECAFSGDGSCEIEVNMAPLVGTYVRVRLGVEIQRIVPARQLTEQSLTKSCAGLSVGVSLGASGSFSGFTFPTSFSRGKENLVGASGSIPPMRPEDPAVFCVQPQQPGTVAAAQMATKVIPWLLTALIAVTVGMI